MGEPGSTDSDIRRALHAKRLHRARADPHTLVIDEPGLAHARVRIDVAVINGSIHGYEIKSDVDTLHRLSTQVEIYRRTLQKLTVVAAPKHLLEVMSGTPEWCGVIAAEEGPRGGIGFRTERSAIANPDVEPVMVAHLLWHDEAVGLLSQMGYAPNQLRRPRKHLYEMLCETMTLREISTAIRTLMARRQAWKDRLAHA